MNSEITEQHECAQADAHLHATRVKVCGQVEQAAALGNARVELDISDVRLLLHVLSIVDTRVVSVAEAAKWLQDQREIRHTATVSNATAASISFNKHIESCRQCKEHPFALCPTGDSIVRAALADTLVA